MRNQKLTRSVNLRHKMVSWSDGEIGLLLTLVKEREALYDFANEDYTNRDFVWALWTDIARQLNKTPTACRDKWTSLRCVYRRIINQKTSSKIKRKIKWPWANLMKFLIPHLKKIQPRYGPDIEINDDDSIITINDHKVYDVNQEAHYLSLNEEDYEVEALGGVEDGIAEYLYEECAESETVEDQSSTVSLAKHIKLEPPRQHRTRIGSHSKKRNENVDEFLNLVQTPTYSVQKEPLSPPTHSVVQDTLSGVDADEMFFRSIVPDVKLLNHKDKAIFKLKVQQLLFEMLYPATKDMQDKDVHYQNTVT